MEPMNAIRRGLTRAALWTLGRASGAGIYLKSDGSSPHISVPRNFPWNWWQKDMKFAAADYERFGPVHTCVTILSQDVSRLPIQHKRRTPQGAREVVLNRAPARIFHRPNRYQTRSDFFLYLMRSLLYDGNAYALAWRNERYEVSELYPLHPRTCWPHIEERSKEVFYSVGGDETGRLAGLDKQEWYPAREILHIRLMTPRHPLIGESPLIAGLAPTLVGTQINNHMASFFTNMGRPSGILRHPGRMDDAAMKRVRERWRELTQGPNTGETPILIEGMDWTQITMDAVSAELIKSYDLSERQIAQLFRVPNFLLSDLDKATISNVEGLMRFYINSALGWYVTHIEQALAGFFGLGMNDSISFDLEAALLRSDFKERMEALGKGVQNGIYSPNEARAREDLPPVEDGDEVRVQQQLVPLSYGMELQPSSGAAVAPDSSSEGDGDEESEDEPSEEERALQQTQARVVYLQQAIED